MDAIGTASASLMLPIASLQETSAGQQRGDHHLARAGKAGHLGKASSLESAREHLGGDPTATCQLHRRARLPNCRRATADVTPFTGPVLMRAGG